MTRAAKAQKAIVLYLHVHQPFRVRHYSIFDAGVDHRYFEAPTYEDDTNNQRILQKVASKSYLPTNRRLLQILKKHPEFKLSLSITGTVLEQMEAWSPESLDSFKDLFKYAIWGLISGIGSVIIGALDLLFSIKYYY